MECTYFRLISVSTHCPCSCTTTCQRCMKVEELYHHCPCRRHYLSHLCHTIYSRQWWLRDLISRNNRFSLRHHFYISRIFCCNRQLHPLATKRLSLSSRPQSPWSGIIRRRSPRSCWIYGHICQAILFYTRSQSLSWHLGLWGIRSAFS